MLFLTGDQTFFDLFDRAADNMVRTAEMFLQMQRSFELRDEWVEKIHKAENEGDSITHETLTRLDQTFITPLDREDIDALVSQTDEVVDYLDAAAKRMALYRVEQPGEDFIRQAEVAVEISKALAAAIKELRSLRKTKKAAQERIAHLVIEIHDWENRGDEHNHRALARLFETNDPMHVLKWKELYELVEMSVDSCETVANTIRSVMVKNA